MNIFYIGSSSALSLVPFKKLLSSNHSITAVGVFNPVVMNEKVFALENESLALAANLHNILLIDLSQPLDIILQQCKKCSIDIILMSCFSKRLPDELINIGHHGCFNMHPSLLPRYRGPEPIFWQMKQASGLGVSWHQVEYDFDAGDIVNQQTVTLCEGATYTEINMQLAETGAKLMMKLLADASEGRLNKMGQDPGVASYYSYPQQQDFVLDLECSVQQAYNFVRATQVFGFSYRCQHNNQSYFLKQALNYDNKTSLKAVEVHGNGLYIPFKDGVLMATYTDKIPV
jgi:methionyl-tRNA formyltransferase